MLPLPVLGRRGHPKTALAWQDLLFVTPRHPTRAAGFILLILTALGGGVLGLVLLDSGVSSTVSAWFTGVSFALFIVLCGVAALGWLWREHEVWRVLGGPEHLAARVRARAEQDAARSAAVRASYAARAADNADRGANDPHGAEARVGPPPRLDG